MKTILVLISFLLLLISAGMIDPTGPACTSGKHLIVALGIGLVACYLLNRVHSYQRSTEMENITYERGSE